jgi:hypothetical protein
MERITPKHNYKSGIFRKIVVRAKSKYPFRRNLLCGFNDFAVIPFDIVVHSNYGFLSERNINNAKSYMRKCVQYLYTDFLFLR